MLGYKMWNFWSGCFSPANIILSSASAFQWSSQTINMNVNRVLQGLPCEPWDLNFQQTWNPYDFPVIVRLCSGTGDLQVSCNIGYVRKLGCRLNNCVENVIKTNASWCLPSEFHSWLEAHHSGTECTVGHAITAEYLKMNLGVMDLSIASWQSIHKPITGGSQSSASFSTWWHLMECVSIWVTRLEGHIAVLIAHMARAHTSLRNQPHFVVCIYTGCFLRPVMTRNVGWAVAALTSDKICNWATTAK